MLTGEPKGNGGSQPGGLSAEGGNDPEFRQTTSGAHGSAGRADYGAVEKLAQVMKTKNKAPHNCPRGIFTKMFGRVIKMRAGP